MNDRPQHLSGKVRIRFIRLPEILERTGVAQVTIRRWEKEGRFPARKRLGRNTVAWLESEFEEWLVSREITTTSGAKKEDL